jgi:hypothetical protein
LSGFTASSASKIVEENRGFLTSSTFTISGTTDGSGQISGNHGLGGSPNQVLVSVFGGSFQHAQVSGITGSAVKVKLLDATSAAMASSGANVYLYVKM